MTQDPVPNNGEAQIWSSKQHRGLTQTPRREEGELYPKGTQLTTKGNQQGESHKEQKGGKLHTKSKPDHEE